MISFNVPPCVGTELKYIKEAIESHKICGDGAFTKKCNAWLEERFQAQKVLLTTSGTTALDMAALLCELEEGDVIAVPNDTTNEARALLLLQDNGVIKLKDGVGLEATARDIEENPNNVEIQELEAAQVSRVAGEVAFVVLNGNYALQAGYSVSKDAVAYEKSDSEPAQTYVNVIAVQEGNEDSDKIKALVDVLKSDEIKDFITENYDGAVIPFEDSAEETEAAE